MSRYEKMVGDVHIVRLQNLGRKITKLAGWHRASDKQPQRENHCELQNVALNVPSRVGRPIFVPASGLSFCNLSKSP